MKFHEVKSWFFVGLIALIAAGCATHKINWASRVGDYTHDQAILELGPPDKQSTLTDGRVVAEWLITRGRAAFYPGVSGLYGYPGRAGYYGAFYPTYVGPGTPDYFLRLTFSPDGKLAAWKKFAR
jgi:hypothetical protein